MKTLAYQPSYFGTRWKICALLFFVATINYMDRQVFGILAPNLQAEIGWTESQYGLIVAAFTCAYAISLLLFGRIFDYIGVRKGLGILIATWSLAVMAHAFANSAMGFAIARFSLGFSEGGNHPALLKATAKWFPKRERSLATGFFNSGTNIGLVAAAIAIPTLTMHFGWRLTFIIQGGIGLICLLVWVWYYYKPLDHSQLSPEELAYIEQDNEEEMGRENFSTSPMPLKQLLTQKETWAYAIGKFMTDPVWWFYLYWLPKYLENDFAINLTTLALPLIIIYVLADIGSIGGGFLIVYFTKLGRNHHEARSMALFVCALFILPIMFLPWVQNVWMAIFLFSLAVAGHQGWSANLLNLPADFFPKNTVASLVGIGGFIGCVGGIIFQTFTGYLLQWNGNHYAPLFIICALVYFGSWMFMRKLTIERRQEIINFASSSA